jgi:signal transduction histidine kinase
MRALTWGLLASALIATVMVRPLPLVTATELRLYDLLLPAPSSPLSDKIAIVAIDEASLTALGQWPWPRSVVARLVTRLRDLGAAVIAFDVIFAEPDRVGVAHAADGHEAVTASDGDLARAIAGGRVILGYAFEFGGAGGGEPACAVHPLRAARVEARGAGDPLDRTFRATSVLCSLPVLTQAASASGFLNVGVDTDGIIRRLPLVTSYGTGVYPSLALAAVLMASNIREVTIQATRGAPLELGLDGTRVELDARGALLLRFYGAGRRFAHLSAAKLLAGEVQAEEVAGRIVFVGATAIGLRDLVATPFDRAFPGIEVHATAVDNLLRRDYLRAPAFEPAYRVLGALAAGLLAAVAVARLGVSRGAALVAVLGGVIWTLSALALARWSIFFSPLPPTLALVASALAMVAVRLRNDRQSAGIRLEQMAGRIGHEVAERDRVARERDALLATERDTHRLKDEFLRNLSHELRTPISSILGWLRLLRQGTDRRSLERGLEIIERNAREQARLIEEVLDFSEIVGGNAEMGVGTVDLTGVVDSAVDGIWSAMTAKSLVIMRHVPPGLWIVHGNVERLRQAVWHVLSNAAKFSPAGGHISITLTVRPGEFDLEIRDQGIGISAEFLPHVFDRFRQADGSSTRKHGGIGLGLSIAREIVQLHGGTITASSTGIGKGAAFCFTLPRVQMSDADRGGDPPESVTPP